MATIAGIGLLLMYISTFSTATYAAPHYLVRAVASANTTRSFTTTSLATASTDASSITSTSTLNIGTTSIASVPTTAIPSVPTTNISSVPTTSIPVVPTTVTLIVTTTDIVDVTASSALTSANTLPSVSTETSTTSTPVSSITSTSSSASSPSTLVPPVPTTPVVPGTLRLSLVNNVDQGPVHAYVTGNDANGQLVMLTNSNEFYFPSSTSVTPDEIPSSADVALKLNGTGETTVFTIPQYITSARVWVAQGKLQFGVTSSGLVEPSAMNDADPNHNTNWGFMELTFQDEEDGGLYANLSFVDFLGLPLGMKVSGSPNVTQSALGPYPHAVESVCRKLKEQAKKDGQPWDKLCKYDNKGKLIRVISPTNLIGQYPSAFEKYFDDYVDAVWEQYSQTPLTIQSQTATGLINCTTSSGDLICDGDDTPFTKPTSTDIFGCNSGPFANGGNDVHLVAVPRVCAAFNRATLHLPGGNLQPSLPPSSWYAAPANNWYAAFVHKAEFDSRGYGFSYDDVTPDMAEYNPAGLLSIANPEELKLYIGGYKDDS